MQDAGEHRRAMFGECVRSIPTAATVTFQPETGGEFPAFVAREREDEIVREAESVSLDGLKQCFGFYLIQHRKVGIQHHLLATDRHDHFLDAWQ